MPSDKVAANLTKYNAGGSGDNIVADGYIKSVCKIWMDSYTGSSITGTKGSIDICTLPEGKKIVDISVYVETSASQTSGSLCIGWSSDALANQGSIFPSATVAHNLTASTIGLSIGGLGLGAVAAGWAGAKVGAFQSVVTGTKNTLQIQFNNWTMTFTSVKSIVYYT